ncbi:hypothetical protein QLG20_09445 [Klebsiella variicola]|uniref:hypothetical protein n=1 Tax=Klebsiella variicola TaxID=244366 RepID=UPI0024A6937B|nr:hypothetical protein [Klebsiella variicola]WHE64547.1 hypothetical protein QLG20_09445 [Klebsiella variicola]HBW0853326.1 hypothetical protein [Klebsiella variicola]HBW0861112.1 hypothetical protein [Klebsiella variicola]HBW0865513.1 hypothetical protein [Klebsiella variicola]
MSFALTGTEYTLLGIELPEGSEGAALTYSVLHFFSLTNGFAIVDFGVYLPDGEQLAFRQFGFDHSGTEDEAMRIAETNLHDYLTA